MGRVYRARRAGGAFDQTVAVKVVRQSLALAGADVASRLQRERALRISGLVYDAGHVRRFEAMGLLGQLLDSAGETREAVVYLDSTVAIARSLPAAQTATGMSMAVTLSQLRGSLGDHRGAEADGRIALQIGEGLAADATRLDELDAMARLQTGMAMHRLGRPGTRATLESAFASTDALSPPVRSAWRDAPLTQKAEQALRTLRRGA